MTSALKLPGRPRGAVRLALRAPALLYRLRLGWLLGHRFLLLTHRGRTSGRIYRAVIEVVRYDRATRESVVLAGFGAGSDWFRNLHAHPALQVCTGASCSVPEQRFLSVDEGYAVLSDYERRNGWLVRYFLGRMYGYDGSDASRRKLAELLPMVAFRPSAAPPGRP